MFAISLVLVLLVSAAVLLYQYWSGALAERGSDITPTELRPDAHDAHPSPARAA
jgi:hypothetical protein